MGAWVIILLVFGMLLIPIGLNAGVVYDKETVMRERRQRQQPDDLDNNMKLAEARRGQGVTWIVWVIGLAATAITLLMTYAG